MPLNLKTWWEKCSAILLLGQAYWYAKQVHNAYAAFQSGVSMMKKTHDMFLTCATDTQWDADSNANDTMWVNLLHGCAMSCLKMGQKAKAIDIYHELVRECLKRYPLQSVRVQHLKLALVRAQLSANSPHMTPEKAEAVFMDALAVYIKTYGRNHRSTLNVAELWCRFKLGTPVNCIPSNADCTEADAARVAETAKDIWEQQKQLLGVEHPDAMNTMTTYAAAMIRLRRPADALRMIQGYVPRHPVLYVLERETARANQLRRSERRASMVATKSISELFK